MLRLRAARVSFHRIQGRITWSAASSAVSPCIWPDSPMARTAAICDGKSTASAVAAAHVACHHCCGSCCDHPACLRLTASDANRLPITSLFHPPEARSRPMCRDTCNVSFSSPVEQSRFLMSPGFSRHRDGGSAIPLLSAKLCLPRLLLPPVLFFFLEFHRPCTRCQPTRQTSFPP